MTFSQAVWLFRWSLGKFPLTNRWFSQILLCRRSGPSYSAKAKKRHVLFRGYFSWAIFSRWGCGNILEKVSSLLDPPVVTVVGGPGTSVGLELSSLLSQLRLTYGLPLLFLPAPSLANSLLVSFSFAAPFALTSEVPLLLFLVLFLFTIFPDLVSSSIGPAFLKCFLPFHTI